METSPGLLRRYAVFPVIVVVTSIVTVLRDVIYVPTLGLLIPLELVRLAVLLITARAVASIARHQNLDEAEKLTWFAVVGVGILDIAVVFAYPSDQIEMVFLNLLLLLAVYFIPTMGVRAKRILIPAYSMIYIAVFGVVNENSSMTKLIVIVVYACLNLLGVFISREAYPDSGTARTAACPETTDSGQMALPSLDTADFHKKIRERVETLNLTEREKEVACHILMGETRTEIADDIYVTEETVKKHTANIYAKLGVSTKSEFFKEE